MDTDKQSKDNKPLNNKPSKNQSLGSYATYASFNTNTDVYKLYNKWTLNRGLDVHICNHMDRNRFQKTHNTSLDNQLFASKTLYLIACFSIVFISANTLNGLGELTLENITLAPGFMTNLVLLNLLNQKGVH